MNPARDRNAGKVRTPKEMWGRLTPLQRATLDAMTEDGDAPPVSAPYHAIRGLIDWFLVTERPRGVVLTVWGRQVRDYGRSLP